jgi:mono/diheme cytochrome c family protein
MADAHRRLVGCLLLSVATIGAGPLASKFSTQPQTRIGTTRDRTVWDGVYSAAQAREGRTAYEQHCASCHGTRLAGGSTRTLVGDSFMRDWSEDTVYHLFETIRSTMPPNPGLSLVDQTYVDIVAYVLQENAFPDGPAPLAADDETLRHIRIENRAGPRPVPSFALVKVTGCLNGRADDDWILTHATEPARTRLPYASEDSGAQPADPMPTGDVTFRLFGIYPDPEIHVGHRIEVRGFLIRNAGGDRINVTSLRPVRPDCKP